MPCSAYKQHAFISAMSMLPPTFLSSNTACSLLLLCGSLLPACCSWARLSNLLPYCSIVVHRQGFISIGSVLEFFYISFILIDWLIRRSSTFCGLTLKFNLKIYISYLYPIQFAWISWASPLNFYLLAIAIFSKVYFAKFDI